MGKIENVVDPIIRFEPCPLISSNLLWKQLENLLEVIFCNLTFNYHEPRGRFLLQQILLTSRGFHGYIFVHVNQRGFFQDFTVTSKTEFEIHKQYILKPKGLLQKRLNNETLKTGDLH